MQGHKNNSHSLYLKFKESLLKAMITMDPLSILQSDIFTNYEKQAFPFFSTPPEMDTIIKEYELEGIKFNVVEKRSHSCDRGMARNIAKEDKLRRMEEQSKIQLVIWSNIMYSLTQRDRNKSICSCKLGKDENNKQNQIIQLEKSILMEELQSNLKAIVCKITKNPTSQNISKILKDFIGHIQQQNDKIIKLLNQFRKQNDKLQRNAQQNSMKELQYIVKIKQLQKRLEDIEADRVKALKRCRIKQQQIRDKESNLSKTLLMKTKEIQHLKQQNERKSYIEELKQKVALDSVRRTTLCTLNKQKFSIQLKKQQLGLTLNSTRTNSSSDWNQNTESTKCDQQLMNDN